jgi:purine-binding chemotaxis protein CheW
MDPARGAAGDQTTELRRQLAELEATVDRVRAELLAQTTGERLAGLHLLVEAGGFRALVPERRVDQVAALVAMRPLPRAPAWMAGTFVCRGRTVMALDLAAWARGRRAEPPLDAHLVIFAGTPAAALLVDAVLSIEEEVTVAAGAVAPVAGRLVAGICSVNGEVLPLLSVEAIERAAAEEAS